MEDAELFKQLGNKERIKLMEKCFILYNDYKTDVRLYREIKKTLLNKLDETSLLNF